jgi:hypothetical protein
MKWYWLEWVDIRGSHRVEVDSLETGEKLIGDMDVDGWRMVDQETGQVMVSDGYEVALDEWIDHEAKFQQWIASLEQTFDDVGLDLSDG